MSARYRFHCFSLIFLAFWSQNGFYGRNRCKIHSICLWFLRCCCSGACGLASVPGIAWVFFIDFLRCLEPKTASTNKNLVPAYDFRHFFYPKACLQRQCPQRLIFGLEKKIRPSTLIQVTDFCLEMCASASGGRPSVATPGLWYFRYFSAKNSLQDRKNNKNALADQLKIEVFYKKRTPYNWIFLINAWFSCNFAVFSTKNAFYDRFPFKNP